MTCDLAMVAPYPGRGSDDGTQSGVAAYTERLAGSLADLGLAVRVLAPEMPGEPRTRRAGQVMVERCYQRGAGALTTAAAAAARTKAPVAHLQFETFLYGGPTSVPAMAPALAALRTRRRGPVVTMHQVVDPVTVDRAFIRVHRVRVPAAAARLGLSCIQRTVRALSAATVVHEPAFAEILRDATVVPIGLERAVVTEDDRRTARRSLGLPDDRLVVLCFGYLAPYKGLEAALEAARLCGGAVELVVAGGSHPRLAGRDDYGENLRNRYARTARFTGYVSDADIAAWFQAADVLLLPYPRPFASSGPFALAMGYGTPPLCSPGLARCLGVPDELVAPIDPPELAAHLCRLAVDPGRLRTLRAVTRAMAAGRSWDQVARRHIAIYEEVIHARSPARRSLRTRKPR